MINTAKSGSVATGVVHSFLFDGPAPDLDTIHRIAYEGETHPALVQHTVHKNRLTDYAVQSSAQMWIGNSVIPPTKLVLGTGTPPIGQTGPLPSDEALWQEDAGTEKVCDILTVFMSVYSEYGVTYQTGEANGTQFTEAGLKDVEGNLWAHVQLNLNKDSGQTAVVLWKVFHQGN